MPRRTGISVADPVERFRRYTPERPAVGCWEYQGHLNKPFGYGQHSVDGKFVGAHRYAWYLATGAWPDGDILHTCDNKPCVRNDDEGTYDVNGVSFPRWGHLFLGNHSANELDLVQKGLHYTQVRPEKVLRGERHGMSRFTEEQVRSILARHAAGTTQAALAREHGVDVKTIWFIVHGQHWAHLGAAAVPVQPRNKVSLTMAEEIRALQRAG